MNGISGVKLARETTRSQDDLGSILWNKLENGKYEEAINEIQEEKHCKYLLQNSLDLVPIILRFLQEDPALEGEACVENLLLHIASVANGKEALIALLEELEINRSDVYFRVLLKPLQVLLLRQVTENTRPMMFSWVFNTLYSHILTLDLPKNYSLEGKERKLLDFFPEVQAFTRTLEWLTDFYSVFYEKVIKGDLVWGGKVQNSRHFLAYFLLQLFHKPYTFLDVYCPEGEVESSLYRTCDKLARMIAHLLGNSFELFSHISWKRSKTVMASDGQKHSGSVSGDSENQCDEKSGNSEDEESDTCEKTEKETVSQLSLASYFYCILSQNMAIEYVPSVYSHQYVFLNCLPLIVHLLELTDDLAIHKGLMLSKSLLDKLSEKSLSNECLEAKAHSSFPQLLTRIMVYSEISELRTLALNIFRPYLKKFDLAGRRNLLKCLLISVKHAGVLGLLIHELKENVALCLSEEVMDSDFSGVHLEKLVMLACVLPDGETTDLLEWSDCIMAALNFLIFVFVRDKEDKTGIRKLVPTLQKDFLDCLQRGLELSRAHYELKLREVAVPRSKKRTEVSVSVKGALLPNLPPDQEEKVLRMALCTFDMMQCVLARASQVVH